MENCFYKKSVKTDIQNLLNVLPIGKGSIIGLWNSTKEFPNGLLYNGSFSFEQINDTKFYLQQNVAIYDQVTFKKVSNVKREAEYIFDKNSICHCIVTIW